MERLLSEAMLKHLPPSQSAMRVLDVGGRLNALINERRPEIHVTEVSGGIAASAIEPVDAVVAFDHGLDPDLLASAIAALRPGGRLIVLSVDGDPAPEQVETLERYGYTRILVETAAECPLPVGVLMRGEKPHTTDDTLQRIKVAADPDTATGALASYSGRYVYLLIRQSPNKPAWAMRADDVIVWEAATFDDHLLAFSSLPKAVAFMQPVILGGAQLGVSKVAKFRTDVVASWGVPVHINPAPAQIDTSKIGMLRVDHAAAEQADE
ncbi:MAG: hypothetical protein IPM16_08685 [Chloroflexi bacterium]|nr:hypothetical protein [Chloroflexota bacterium]